jgi:hypothetical protein
MSTPLFTDLLCYFLQQVMSSNKMLAPPFCNMRRVMFQTSIPYYRSPIKLIRFQTTQTKGHPVKKHLILSLLFHYRSFTNGS